MRSQYDVNPFVDVYQFRSSCRQSVSCYKEKLRPLEEEDWTRVLDKYNDNPWEKGNQICHGEPVQS